MTTADHEPDRAEALATMLAFFERVYVHIDGSTPGVEVPAFTVRARPIYYILGSGLAEGCVRDLKIQPTGWSADLDFGMLGRHSVIVPWSAVWAIVNERSQGYVWEYRGPIAPVLVMPPRKPDSSPRVVSRDPCPVLDFVAARVRLRRA